MPTLTKLGLRKPADLDNFGQDDFNYNSDQLDKAVAGRVFAVAGYGGAGDGATNNDAAIAAALADLVAAGGGTLQFGPGVWQFNTQLLITANVPLRIAGLGRQVTRLAPTFAGGDAILINGPSYAAVDQLAITPTLARTAGTYDLHVRNCIYARVTDCHFNNAGGGLLMAESCNFLLVTGCQGDSNDGARGDTCLRIKACGGTISNCYFRTAGSGGTQGRSPTVWITGQTTSLRIANCNFSGGGPASIWTVGSITSNAAQFVVTTTAPHDFQVGDFLVLRGITPAAYNDLWRISAVTATTITVTTTANPGTATVLGTAESVSATVLVTNADGAVNESALIDCLLEGIQPNVYGTAGVYLDARRGVAGARAGIAGWQLDSNYYDYGAISVLLSGTAASAANDPTCYGITISGGILGGRTRGIHLDQVNGITIDNVVTDAQSILADQITPGFSCGLYIYAGPSAPFARGITVTGSQLGPTKSWFDGNFLPRSHSYGLGLDSPGIQDLVVVGNYIFGQNGPVVEANTPVATDRRWLFANNIVDSGAGAVDQTTVIPSVASAATITPPKFNDVIKVTGTTNITSVAGGWIGRRLTLLFTGALTLLTGGNLAIAANYAVSAGQLVTLVYDGTSWYLK